MGSAGTGRCKVIPYDLERLGYHVGDVVKHSPHDGRLRDALERRGDYMSGPLRDARERAVRTLEAERMTVESIEMRGGMVPGVTVRYANGGLGRMFATAVVFDSLPATAWTLGGSS